MTNNPTCKSVGHLLHIYAEKIQRSNVHNITQCHKLCKGKNLRRKRYFAQNNVNTLTACPTGTSEDRTGASNTPNTRK